MPLLPEIYETTALKPQWSSAPEQARFGPTEIHLWRAELDNPQLLRLANEILSSAEIVRCEYRGDAADRVRTFALHGLARSVLSRYVDLPPDELRFTHDELGRPQLALSTLCFAMSYAENLALIAVAPFGEIGVEVERVRDDLPFDEMAAHFFEPVDHWSIRTTPGRSEKASQFFDLWTTHEASRQTTTACLNRLAEPLSIHRLQPAEGFAAAVAVVRPDAQLRFFDWAA